MVDVEIMEVVPINEEIWVVTMNKDEYYCEKIIGLCKCKEKLTDKEKENPINKESKLMTSWDFCIYSDMGIIAVYEMINVGIIFGKPTVDNIKRCIEHRGECASIVNGFISGELKHLGLSEQTVNNKEKELPILRGVGCKCRPEKGEGCGFCSEEMIKVYQEFKRRKRLTASKNV